MFALLILAGLLAALVGKFVAATTFIIAAAVTLLEDPVVLDTVSWGLILGVLTPLATALVQQPRWGTKTRAVVGALVAIVVGVVTCLANGDIESGQTVLATVAVVLVAAQATYKGFWQPTRIAPKVEAATSPGAPAVAGGDARHAG
jgi:hypothetical protein